MKFDLVSRQHLLQGIKDYVGKGFPNGFGPSTRSSSYINHFKPVFSSVEVNNIYTFLVGLQHHV